jgi:hypothetical protein
MFTQSDKAWVGGIVTLVGQYLAQRFSLGSFLTPELLAVIAGAAVYWVPNKIAGAAKP